MSFMNRFLTIFILTFIMVGDALAQSFEEAIVPTHPAAVSISTYPETHETYALAALDKGCHVFLEKPIATSVEGGKRILKKMITARKKVVVGYIL